jgi:hypothetical protein
MKEFIKKIKEMYNDPKGRGILFFGFYFIFFVGVILLVRFGSRNPVITTEYEKGNSNSNYSYDITGIAGDNYTFTYTISLDGVNYIYSGSKYNDLEEFIYNNKNYFRNGDNYFVNNSLWIKSDNPYIYSDFLDYDNICDMIIAATYESKTSYDSGKEIYNYLISSNTINSMINGIDSDYLEEPNKITVITDEDKNVSEIIFNLDSYCTVNKLCTSSLKIDLSYDNFKEVDEIENPIG